MARVRARHRVVFLALIISVVPGCTSRFTKTVAKVGPFEISQAEVDRQMQINSIMQLPTNEEQTLAQLKELRLREWIMLDEGFTVGEIELNNEAQRIDKNTKDPETLAEIKKVFGLDIGAYQHQYIRGILVSRSFEPFFKADSRLHVVAKGRAEEFLHKAMISPKIMDVLAKASSYSIYDYKYSKTQGIEKIEVRDPIPKDPGVADPYAATHREPIGIGQPLEAFLPWVTSAHLALKNEEVFPEVIIGPDGFLVLQMLSAKSPKKQIWLRTVVIPRADFNEWFQAERARRQ